MRFLEQLPEAWQEQWQELEKHLLTCCLYS